MAPLAQLPFHSPTQLPPFRQNAPRLRQVPAIGQAFRSALPVERTEQREQAPRCSDVYSDLALQALHEKPATFIVQSAAADIDRLDTRGRLGLDRLIVAFAHHEIVLHDAPERSERQRDIGDRLAVLVADGEHEAVVGERKMQSVGTLFVGLLQGKAIRFEQIEDRNVALVVHVDIVAADRSLVERDADQPLPVWMRVVFLGDAHDFTFNLMATERRCASRPSALASAMASADSAVRLSISSFKIEVRFMKSSTLRPDAKRALRAVGNT